MSSRTTTGKSFTEPKAFRDWLAKHHASETELLVRLFKVHAREKGMTYSDALDEALCFGWIDGVRRGEKRLASLIEVSAKRKPLPQLERTKT